MATNKTENHGCGNIMPDPTEQEDRAFRYQNYKNSRIGLKMSKEQTLRIMDLTERELQSLIQEFGAINKLAD